MVFLWGKVWCVLEPMVLFRFYRSLNFYLLLPSFPFPSSLQGTPASSKPPEWVPSRDCCLRSSTRSCPFVLIPNSQVSDPRSQTCFPIYPLRWGSHFLRVILSESFWCWDPEALSSVLHSLSSPLWGLQNSLSWFQMSILTYTYTEGCHVPCLLVML